MRGAFRSERGSTLVEFVFVAIAVLTVMFAVLEVGRLMLSYVTIAEAARIGVRYAIVNGAHTPGSVAAKAAAVKTVAQGVGSAAGVSLGPSDVSVSYTPCASCGGYNAQGVGATVTVQISYTFAPAVPLVSALGVTIRSSSQGTISY